MGDELVSLRILLFAGAAAERDVMRRGALAASIPVDVVEADTIAAARGKMSSGNLDVVFIDVTIADHDRAALIAEAQSAAQKPFVFLVAANLDEAQSLSGSGADGVVV